MQKVLTFYKKEGETPLEALGRLRLEKPEYQGVSLTYAGRLDPLAHGLLLVLAGEAVHEKEKFCACDKEYRVTALVGCTTDTYDLLGVPVPELSPQVFSQQEMGAQLNPLVGQQAQPYPPYSSRTVDGKPLWQWAREGALDTISIPTHDIEVYSIGEMSLGAVARGEVLARVRRLANIVAGDFRQEEIIAAWGNTLETVPATTSFQTISFTVACSAGTYVRGLVEELGKRLGVGACVWELERTHILFTID